ncbi:hypothetical protein GLOIN_2v1579220 [Rhizophagus irregularis DAOM 181602=DAOM 197198]|uniref:Uncharacterized protein n=1 Tax=Rhizophagus irregularis (strain DAOM 181602 / DAOM 197198 / MUCL 43194) TaxID=747089 RepID=A0A2P4Q8W9_RHIID|nr:hypothetical protein GLOIN_2v1579220 [Rhizophagus irregularis DAOM 181602=DAOM 197198]POG74076.1 hypothetical protein GLOIN_2v1579220 [Rhizophagus irregularis DAOM 181602=DAOM 197198]|eukprot:XP_025180942.1 hypothetical protein GLOIN_2v1579220 [Rhizophagus irregularis DAOM 181602=DAOM 197198]
MITTLIFLIVPCVNIVPCANIILSANIVTRKNIVTRENSDSRSSIFLSIMVIRFFSRFESNTLLIDSYYFDNSNVILTIL